MSEAKDKKGLSKKAKKGITLGVIAAVIIAILVSGIVILSDANKQTKLYNRLAVAIMPESITGSDNGRDITFYIENNNDYNPDKDEPLDAFTVYYYDNENNRIDLAQGHYKTAATDMQVTIGFLMKAQERLGIIKNVFSVILSLAFLAVIAFLIYLWYKSWCRRQDKQKALMKEAGKKTEKQKEE